MKPPIVLFTYNRPLHTQQTIQALLANPLAKESDLFIFADAAKNEADIAQVQQVHDLLKKVKGFKEIYLNIQEKNQGLAHAIISGVGKVLQEYPTAIIMEDDMICAKNFLDYMHQALDTYIHCPQIFSITGYNFPIPIPPSYTAPVYLSLRPSSWGWATWRDRWQKADWEVKDFSEFIKNSSQRHIFNEGGEDLSVMLLKQQKGEISSWAIRWAYTHFKHQAYCVYPTRSKIHNIGADSSGTHTPATHKYDVSLDESSYDLPTKLTPNAEILYEFKKFFRRSLIRKAINWFKYGITA